jgi:hypothetical protein
METENEEYEPRIKMSVYHNDEIVLTSIDGGEPEDNTFGRDWAWVPGAIEMAYRLGREDAAAAIAKLIRED